ncbi:MAG: sigma-70 family RNA polymerase sigma factor [Planctomycetes bacterium]|nr:sigma-70 family RNA polymerase sigma factor [Planctomycetota bacterium]
MSEFTDSDGMDLLLEKLRNNDKEAKNAIIVHTLNRLERISRRMFHKFPVLKQSEETGDILHMLVLKLDKALSHVTPDSVSGYFALVNLNLNWILKELARKSKSSVVLKWNGLNDILYGVKDPYSGPANNEEWFEFFEILEKLSPESREVFDLMWLQGLNQKQAAKILGISLRTFIRRWIKSKLEIRKLINDELPTYGLR